MTRFLHFLLVWKIRDALLEFEQSGVGQTFFSATGQGGLKPLDAYARDVKRALELPK